MGPTIRRLCNYSCRCNPVPNENLLQSLSLLRGLATMANTRWRSWLNDLARTLGSKRRSQRAAGMRRPFPRRLELERLEDRLVPAAILVTGGAGANTLVVNAAGPDSGSYSLNGGAAV